jgi:DNA (cytosine-5)-methyltransferase 1
VLDLFAGIGGMSLGFRDEGFRVVGVDVEETSRDTFRLNRIGEHLLQDLRDQEVLREVPVLVGGPPCRPWSSVNLQRRGRHHGDHGLLHRFFLHVRQIRPHAFLMENVPPLMKDPDFLERRADLESRGYSVESRVLRYSHFGAATSRRRLFTFGIRAPLTWGAKDFFELLDHERQESQDVRSAIGWLRDLGRNQVPDHDWSELQTIEKYKDRYESGQFGWRVLNWDEPAPSFGSIAKTYILHPDSIQPEIDARVLSVREVLSLMGFERRFRFPAGTPRSRRYRMAANAVSPIVARACARVIRRLLWQPESAAEPARRTSTTSTARPDRQTISKERDDAT